MMAGQWPRTCERVAIVEVTLVPVPGLFRIGDQVTRSNTLHPREPGADNQVAARLRGARARARDEHEPWDAMHEFRLKVWPRLYKREVCAAQNTDQ